MNGIRITGGYKVVDSALDMRSQTSCWNVVTTKGLFGFCGQTIEAKK
jgi:hypothetical protein